MSVVLGPTSAKAPVGEPAPGSRLPASADTHSLEADASGSQQTQAASRKPQVGSRVMSTVRNLARFAYDLLHELF